MFKLGSFISPSIGAGILRNQISKSLNKKVNDFDLLFMTGKKNLKIVVDSKYYDFENDTLQPIIETKAKESLKPEQKLDFVRLEFRDKKIIAKIYLIENEEKKCLIYTL
jgi:hypothetical protein